MIICEDESYNISEVFINFKKKRFSLNEKKNGAKQPQILEKYDGQLVKLINDSSESRRLLDESSLQIKNQSINQSIKPINVIKLKWMVAILFFFCETYVNRSWDVLRHWDDYNVQNAIQYVQ